MPDSSPSLPPTTTPVKGLALALSGGGARGIAHLGVLAALDELQLPIAHLAGVSSGAIAGAFYAAGFAPREILRLFMGVRITRLTRMAFSRYGLLDLRAVQQLFAQHLGADCTFADLKTPLTLVATDLAEGASVYFSEGPLIQPLLASSAVPVLYRPVEYQGRQLVDGGLLNNLPVDALLGRGRPVVAVNCIPTNRSGRVAGFRSLVERTLNLIIGANSMLSKLQCDLLLEPEELRAYRPLDYRRGQELFDIGYRHTLAQAAELTALAAA
ncbi:patatin-like phospholipase family protein [Hymenobacter psychrotolerans]|uniref:NTE family protein n=1 Tax=Hymenobacter psychrotolerans DSM 18569 TaxID=1121959 RepID=A0A1M6UT29_9BACT|nr:patatin-like phospholipase family protein [Hymenobacter psychrotolerans]SHK72324.1 NTE family protein [Hymenobacter psychrotolerans DSM 18569]